eukprot:8740844-Pyramimonas_sp.AAC.1
MQLHLLGGPVVHHQPPVEVLRELRLGDREPQRVAEGPQPPQVDEPAAGGALLRENRPHQRQVVREPGVNLRRIRVVYLSIP